MTSLNFETLSATRTLNSPMPDQRPDSEAKPQSNLPQSDRQPLNRAVLVSWLFLIGSLMFVLDAVLENARGISFSSLLHLSASILFTIGSVLFIPNNSES